MAGASRESIAVRSRLEASRASTWSVENPNVLTYKGLYAMSPAGAAARIGRISC